MNGVEKTTEIEKRHRTEVSTMPSSIVPRTVPVVAGVTAIAKIPAKKTTVFGLARSVQRPRQKCARADTASVGNELCHWALPPRCENIRAPSQARYKPPTNSMPVIRGPTCISCATPKSPMPAYTAPPNEKPSSVTKPAGLRKFRVNCDRKRKFGPGLTSPMKKSITTVRTGSRCVGMNSSSLLSPFFFILPIRDDLQNDIIKENVIYFLKIERNVT